MFLCSHVSPPTFPYPVRSYGQGLGWPSLGCQHCPSWRHKQGVSTARIFRDPGKMAPLHKAPSTGFKTPRTGHQTPPTGFKPVPIIPKMLPGRSRDLSKVHAHRGTRRTGSEDVSRPRYRPERVLWRAWSVRIRPILGYRWSCVGQKMVQLALAFSTLHALCNHQKLLDPLIGLPIPGMPQL